MSDTPVGLAEALRDRYVLERELGRGGMATVWLARDLRHERLVALKVLHHELVGALGPERFLREIAIAARLQHPNILPLFDSGTAVIGGGAARPYYVMPYVAGESLRARLERETQLGLQAALGFALQVAAALSHAHAQGIVHRDIKPENILLENGHALVADFGIAQALDLAGGEKLTETGLSLGTPVYMSPEQAAAGRVDARADIYSLACVLYEMLAGTPPFTGATPRAIMARHALDPVPPLRTTRPEVPGQLDTVLHRALAKVPADRSVQRRSSPKRSKRHGVTVRGSIGGSDALLPGSLSPLSASRSPVVCCWLPARRTPRRCRIPRRSPSFPHCPRPPTPCLPGWDAISP